MNGAHIHLLLNHVPVIGTFFTILLLIYGLSINNEGVKKAALLMMIFTTLIGIPAYLSGEDAQDILQPITGINRETIATHEEMAHIAFRIMIVTGLIALITLFYKTTSKLITKILFTLNAVLILITFILMARTGLSGGEIRHTEIFFEKSLY